MKSNFLTSQFPNVKKRNISELLDSPLEINAANGTSIPYTGWAELEFLLLLFVAFCCRKEDQNIGTISDYVRGVVEHVVRNIDLSGLSLEQRNSAREMLLEESESFARDDDDIGYIPNLRLNINLSDSCPVRKNYTSIPRPLYQEVKGHIEDRLNKQFIQKSQSPYSSPVVCVQKKDGTLRLCVDYRELNRRKIPDRHPTPRVEETLDNIGGNFWFSVIDQGKAYHQGVMDEGSHLTAFITPLGHCEWLRINECSC